MTARSSVDQIPFRYRAADSATGVTRDTAKRLAERLVLGHDNFETFVHTKPPRTNSIWHVAQLRCFSTRR